MTLYVKVTIQEELRDACYEILLVNYYTRM